MTQAPAPGTDIEVGATLQPETIQMFASMAMLIPAEGADAVESIVSAILNAPDWDSLDDPWETGELDYLIGKTWVVQDIQRRPSDFKDGLGIFLVVNLVSAKDGEKVTWTTGSVSCVAQLARAYAGGWLPLAVQIVVADRPSKSGYRPHHLKFIGKPGAKVTAAADQDPAF